MKSYIDKLTARQNLTQAEMSSAMKAIMSGQASLQDMEDFLVALRDKGYTVEEITAAARTMKDFSLKVQACGPIVLDTCGTGGDRRGTFNVSTIVAIVAASAGALVAKHGNRSISSRCGSADVLEALGVHINLNVRQAEACLEEAGIVFLFAPNFHPAMKHVAPVRKKVGVTIFNLLGPLVNPAHATHQVAGVYDENYLEAMAEALKSLGSRRAMVVCAKDGLDEISTTTSTMVCEWNGQSVRRYSVHPEDFGMTPACMDDLTGGDLASNVQIVRDILSGQNGPKRDIVLLNAAHALVVIGRVKDVPEGIALAKELIDSGKARRKLDEWIEFSQRYGAMQFGSFDF